MNTGFKKAALEAQDRGVQRSECQPWVACRLPYNGGAGPMGLFRLARS